MKTCISIILFIGMLSQCLYGQDYQVSKLIGNVYHGGRPLAQGDFIKSLDKLSARTADAAIRLISTKNGVVVISFSQGKKIKNPDKADKSEFYELVVQDYINKFTRHNSTGVMGIPQEYDWYNFFYRYPDTVQRRMLIVEGQKIPFKSNVFPKTSQRFKIFARISKNTKDTVSIELPIDRDSINFPASSFSTAKVFNMDVYLAFTDEAGHYKTVNVTKRPIESYYINLDELKNLMRIFSDKSSKGFSSVFIAKSEFYSYLDFNYTRFYYPFIQTQADKIFK